MLDGRKNFSTFNTKTYRRLRKRMSRPARTGQSIGHHAKMAWRTPCEASDGAAVVVGQHVWIMLRQPGETRTIKRCGDMNDRCPLHAHPLAAAIVCAHLN